MNKEDFKEAVLKNVSFEIFGYRKADYDRIQAIKSEPARDLYLTCRDAF